MADLIDRQAAIDATWFEPSYTDPLNVLTEVRDRLEVLPSAQPNLQPTCNQLATDCISRQAAIKAIENLQDCYNGFSDTYDKACIIGALEEVPSAQPERRGKWQITDAYPHNVYCSECHTRFAQTHWAVWEDGSLPRNFCPNCGARMEVEE